MRSLLLSSLVAAPLDLGELWAVALRFGLFGLLRAHDPAMEQLLDVVSAPVQDGGRCSRNRPPSCQSLMFSGSLMYLLSPACAFHLDGCCLPTGLGLA